MTPACPMRFGGPMHIDLVPFLTGNLGLKAHSIGPGATLEEAGIDSLAVVELAVMLENDYGVVIDEDELSSVPSVAALNELVYERVASRTAGASSGRGTAKDSGGPQ